MTKILQLQNQNFLHVALARQPRDLLNNKLLTSWRKKTDSVAGVYKAISFEVDIRIHQNLQRSVLNKWGTTQHNEKLWHEKLAGT